ncbi:hypothetical protein ACVWZ4_006958 [Bradyrhizobium sp. USDA 4472]
MDDVKLAGRAASALRITLPYLAVFICIAVAAWLTWSRLL